MKHLFSLLFIPFTFILYGQGSESSILFNGNNERIELPADILSNPSELTIEFWLKSNNIGNNPINQMPYSIEGHYFARILTNGDLLFVFDGTTQGSTVFSAGLNDNKWHHIAGVNNGTHTTVYVNGIKLGSFPDIIDQTNLHSRVSTIGSQWNNTRNFNGEIDEFRIWTTARTQDQIREKMTSHLSGNENGLFLYYKFDEGSGTNVLDEHGANNGILKNMNPVSSWKVSAAPIGDESIYVYPTNGNWNNVLVSLNSIDRGNVEIKNIIGNHKGLHLYKINGVPNSTNGINPPLGSNDVYYGVFLTKEINNNYEIEYDFSNYADAVNEYPNLILYKRKDNSTVNWMNTNAAITGNSLVKTIDQSREFIIAGSSAVLPIELVGFNVQSINSSSVEINWKTISEINNDYFTVERSQDNQIWDFVDKIDGAGNSTETITYYSYDDDPQNGTMYYRLKQTDFDGQYSYSEIKSVRIEIVQEVEVSAYPNPTSTLVQITSTPSELETVRVYNSFGQEVTVQVQQFKKQDNETVLDFSQLDSGVYIIQTKTKSTRIIKT